MFALHESSKTKKNVMVVHLGEPMSAPCKKQGKQMFVIQAHHHTCVVCTEARGVATVDGESRPTGTPAVYTHGTRVLTPTRGVSRTTCSHTCGRTDKCLYTMSQTNTTLKQCEV